MNRIVRGVGALMGLLIGLLGVPIALILLGADVWPNTWEPAVLGRALLRPDDGRILLGLLTVVGWTAWLVFAVSVVAEAIGLASHRRLRLRIPLLAAPQRLSAALLIAVLALVPLAPLAHADPTPKAPQPEQGRTRHAQVSQSPPEVTNRPPSRTPPRAEPPTAQVITTTAADADPDKKPDQSSLVHSVQSGDDLWTLAERYYGDGMNWRKIAKANGDVLTGGPDRLIVGWKLTIPGVAAAPDGDGRTTTVRRGDTLSSIADQELGASSRWPEVFRANRAVLEDPDELTIGTTLSIPAAHKAATDEDRPEDSTTEASKTARTGSTYRAHRDGGGEKPSAPDLRRSSDQDPTAHLDRPGAPTERTEAQPSATAPVSPATAPASAPETTADDGRRREITEGEAAQGQTTKGPTTKGQTTKGQTTKGQTTGGETAESETTQDGAASTRDPDELPDLARAPMTAFAGIGGLLAAGLIGALAHRRRLQLQTRPVGRRILHADDATASAEVVLGATQRPLDLGAVDTAVRAIGLHCRRTGQPVPGLSLVRFDEESIEITVTSPDDDAPLGFTRELGGWFVTASDALYLASVPGMDDSIRPYPSLVELGVDEDQRSVLVNLEELGLLSLTGDREQADDLLSAMGLALAFAPWADEMILTLVGDRAGLPHALDKHNVTTTDEVDALLDHLEARARAQREQHPDGPAGHFRIDPDLSDPWAPEVILIRRPLDGDQQRRFVALVTDDPRPTIAVVTVGEIEGAPWTLAIGASDAMLQPVDLRLTPRRLPRTAEDTVVSLVAATGSVDTTPAPWWADEEEPPDPPPDGTDSGNVAHLARRSAGWATGIDEENGRDMAQNPVIGRDTPPDHPVLLILGPIDLVGARGQLPPRAAKQCLEYCGWLLEHPGTSAQAMGTALLVAEGTRRSNMSRLRTWLGADEEQQAYLPDAYSGRILLRASVSSDWQRLQILTATGVNRTSDNGLRSALELVRGAPLADAAPGQWHWAEELRTDMISAVRDIGVELAGRANEAGELDLARWSAARALAAAPGDELLMATRIRTEYLAGNRAETERLTLQLAAQARTLGVDLDPETVELLQQVLEGRVRARLA